MEIQAYKSVFETHLSNYLQKSVHTKQPSNLYRPIAYILNIGGKRIRPILTLMACDLFDGTVKDALNAAMCIELFHNFTLLHDDIMDKADIRRGKTTVHKKWDENIAILSGDAMMFMAAQQLECYEADCYKSLSKLFNKTAIEVCEGQQMDMDFENRMDVALDEYLGMIGYKTAVLLGCALQMGAIIASVSVSDAKHIYDFGLTLGLAFQLQDDYLDTFGDENFGKTIGGDINENKKTYLFLKTLDQASDEDKSELLTWFRSTEVSDKKQKSVKKLYQKYKVDKQLLQEIKQYTSSALAHLNKLSVKEEKKQMFVAFAHDLMNRTI